MSAEEDRKRLREVLPGAISQEMRAAQIRLHDHLKSLGEEPPRVVPNGDQNGFVVTVSREWLGMRFTLWEEIWPIEWVHA